MNNYIIEASGKTYIVQGINLENALTKLGYTNIMFTPKLGNKSNGQYYATTSECAIVQCTCLHEKFGNT